MCLIKLYSRFVWVFLKSSGLSGSRVMIQCTLPQPARNPVSSIFQVSPQCEYLCTSQKNPRNRPHYAHSCARLQVAFVSFRRTTGCDQGIVWSQFSLTCGGVMRRGSECDFARM